MNFKFNKDSSLEEEIEEEFEEVEEIEEIEEVVEQLKSDSLKDMFPLIEDLKNKIKKGTEEEVAEICAIAGIEKTDSAMQDLCNIWRNS
tara:strand:- start:679 stop:945 length:267 start_codon:yes stop_codon:yes gene_type:complete